MVGKDIQLKIVFLCRRLQPKLNSFQNKGLMIHMADLIDPIGQGILSISNSLMTLTKVVGLNFLEEGLQRRTGDVPPLYVGILM